MITKKLKKRLKNLHIAYGSFSGSSESDVNKALDLLEKHLKNNPDEESLKEIEKLKNKENN